MYVISTILFFYRTFSFFRVMLPILLTFKTPRQFWSALPKVFNSCPKTLSLISLAKLPWTSEGEESGQWWTESKTAAGNCHYNFGHGFCPQFSISPIWEHYRCLSLEVCRIQAYTVFWLYVVTFIVFKVSTFWSKKPNFYIKLQLFCTQKKKKKKSQEYGELLSVSLFINLSVVRVYRIIMTRCSMHIAVKAIKTLLIASMCQHFRNNPRMNSLMVDFYHVVHPQLI